MSDIFFYILSFSIDAVNAIIICRFLIRFTGAAGTISSYIILCMSIFGANLVILYTQVGAPAGYAMVFAVILLFCLFSLRTSIINAATAALVPIVVTSVTGNILASILNIAGAYLPASRVFIINFFITAASVLLLWAVLRYILKLFLPVNQEHLPYIYILWLPLAMIFMFSEAFAWAATSDTMYIDPEGFGHTQARLDISGWPVLFFFVFALCCIFILFFSYQKITSYHAKQQQNERLEYELRLQQEAVKEANARYDLTRAYRHDLNNHLAVISGLIENGRYDEARSYLSGTMASSSHLSHPINSGSAALDVLLGEKLETARSEGIDIQCNALIGHSAIDEYDLCIIMGNALDNAIRACEGVAPGEKYIRINITQIKDFIHIMITNPKNGTVKKGSGYGLRNIRAVVMKYNGSMDISDSRHIYKLDILLAIPLQK